MNHMSKIRKRKAKKILKEGKALIERQGSVSIGFGTRDLTCAIGALGVVQGLAVLGGIDTDARDLLDEAARELYPGTYGVGNVNDELGYLAVLAVYEKALTL